MSDERIELSVEQALALVLDATHFGNAMAKHNAWLIEMLTGSEDSFMRKLVVEQPALVTDLNAILAPWIKGGQQIIALHQQTVKRIHEAGIPGPDHDLPN